MVEVWGQIEGFDPKFGVFDRKWRDLSPKWGFLDLKLGVLGGFRPKMEGF